MNEATTSRLAGTPDAELREMIFRYALEQTDPHRHEHIRRLFGRWDEWNAEFFDGLLTPAVLLLNGPEATLCYGDCSMESGFGCGCQIRIRRSILAGTLKDLKGGNRDPEGLMRFAEDVLLHEMVHQWSYENFPIPVLVRESENYNGHGPIFAEKANEIGARLGLPPVGRFNKTKRNKGLPLPTTWPHIVRSREHYLGAYVPATRDMDVELQKKLGLLLRQHGIEKVEAVTREVWQRIEEHQARA
jgi:hypothetical protein